MTTTPIHADTDTGNSRVAHVTTVVGPGVPSGRGGKQFSAVLKELKCGTGDSKWSCAVLF